MVSDREQAFLELVRTNEARLSRICRIYERDPEARRDLYQEMLVQLWRALPSFAGRSQQDTWLYRVALNTALSHRRRQAARRETSLEQSAEPASATPGADERLEATQRLARLYAAIETLGDIDKILVTMFLDERSYRDIAEVLGISESNVGVRLHRVKKTLAGMLDGESR